MKINELFKHLENIKIGEDKINENNDEKHEIIKYLAQTLRFDEPSHKYYHNYIYHYFH